MRAAARALVARALGPAPRALSRIESFSLSLSLSPRRRSLSRDSGVRRATRSTCKQERGDALSSASVLAELFFFSTSQLAFLLLEVEVYRGLIFSG